jgi:tRNA threonylcarbamoyladenosine biosynthesis protein TsaB
VSIRGLAIETSGRLGSVALVEDGNVLDDLSFEHGLQHAAMMLPMIDRLCAARRWKPADLHELYVSAGPGSFTGLRIGITLVKTLAMATGAKVAAVPSVRVLAENAPEDARNLIIVLDAKRDQIFTARFERENAGWAIREDARLDSLTDTLGRSPRPVHLLGEGIPYHEKFIPRVDAGVIVVAKESWRARASSVARLGWKMARDEAFSDPWKLTPIYIRRPEAEEKWEKRISS